MLKFGRTLFFILAVALPLSAQQIRGRVVLQSDASPLPGVTVSIEGWGLTAITDADGRYTLDATGHSGTAKVAAALQGFQTRTATVTVGQGEITQDFSLHVSFGQEITVGSRAIGAEQEQAVPVDIIPQEQIESAPSTETNQIIQKLSPSFNFPRPTISDGTDSVRPATLRGLGPDQLLVMLNGKRRHASALVNANNTVGRGSSGVDLNAIPASAIESIEILRDGAAAQYGSDAIAGVINLVMKSSPEPLKVDLKAGTTTHGDGEMLNLAVSGGWALGRGAIFVAGEHRTRYDTNRANPDLRDQFVPGDAGHNSITQPNTHWGDSYARDVMLFSNLNLPLNAAGSQIFYAFGGYSLRHGSHGGNYRRAIDANNWRQIYPNGFLPLIEPRVADTSLTAGARGQLATWFYDLSTAYGRNELDFYVTDSLNASLGPNIPPNQTRFYAGALGDKQLTANLDLSRRFSVGLAGPLNVAFGAEYRGDSFEEHAGEPSSYINGGVPNQAGGRAAAGAQVFPGFQPSNEVDVSRNSRAVYADLEGDVHAKFRLGLAGRFEHFSDFGNTTNGKITARYSPARQWIFRAAASTGFRAPALNQGFWSAISTNFIPNSAGVVEAVQVGTFRVNAPIARALGATDLKPEKSKNLSAGMVWQPLTNLEFTADFFHIDIKDRIVYSGNFNQDALKPILEPFGVGGVRFLTNAIDTKTNGFDLVTNYQRPLLGGRVDLSAAYSNNKTEVVHVEPTPGPLVAFGQTLFDRQELRRFQCGQPRDNIRLMQSWNRSGWNVTTRESRYGEYCSLTLAPIDDQTYDAEWLADAEVAYRWNQYTFAVGAENLFDNFPDRNFLFRPGTGPGTGVTGVLAQQSGAGGTNSYPINAAFGMNGRFVYSRVTYRF
ncbi:MAG TPA: TonB-dependent receptor [Thermoanaerobaculia bacterium]|jgi:iron complex outermembrane receptor protein|nr:TonB-dependent receptor [Thermoanaerobaculia bacterium]